MEPESQFCTLPNEITLEIIHGQESGDLPPELNQVEDEIDIQQFTSDPPQQDNPRLKVYDEIYIALSTTSMLKLLNSKQNKKTNKIKKPKKHAKEVQDEFACTSAPVQSNKKTNKKAK